MKIASGYDVYLMIMELVARYVDILLQVLHLLTSTPGIPYFVQPGLTGQFSQLFSTTGLADFNYADT